jgi:hypothetical protein
LTGPTPQVYYAVWRPRVAHARIGRFDRIATCACSSGSVGICQDLSRSVGICRDLSTLARRLASSCWRVRLSSLTARSNERSERPLSTVSILFVSWTTQTPCAFRSHGCAFRPHGCAFRSHGSFMTVLGICGAHRGSAVERVGPLVRRRATGMSLACSGHAHQMPMRRSRVE